MNENKQIIQILSKFDFEKVHKMMMAVNWGWMSVENFGVPSVSEMVLLAQRLLKDVVVRDEDFITIGTGGFEATKYYEILSLKFVVEQWEYMDDE